MLNKDTYKNILVKTKDPMKVCYLVYNTQARTKIPTFQHFSTLFFAWSLRTGGGNGLMRSLQIKKNFDKKFGL